MYRRVELRSDAGRRALVSWGVQIGYRNTGDDLLDIFHDGDRASRNVNSWFVVDRGNIQDDGSRVGLSSACTGIAQVIYIYYQVIKPIKILVRLIGKGSQGTIHSSHRSFDRDGSRFVT